jgi:hypothetical protein
MEEILYKPQCSAIIISHEVFCHQRVCVNPLNALVTTCNTCFNIKKLNFVHKVYLCVFYDAQNKRQLYP